MLDRWLKEKDKEAPWSAEKATAQSKKVRMSLRDPWRPKFNRHGPLLIAWDSLRAGGTCCRAALEDLEVVYGAGMWSHFAWLREERDDRKARASTSD